MGNLLSSNKTVAKKLHVLYIVKEADTQDLYDDILAGTVELPPYAFVQLESSLGVKETKLTGAVGGFWADAEALTATAGAITIAAYPAGGVLAGSLQETVEALADRITALEP